MGYVTLDTIVRDLLSEEGRNTTHEYLRYLNFANKGLKTLTYDVLGETKITLLTINDALRADLPDDFIDYSFVGLVDAKGRLTTLGSKRNIPLVGTANTITPKSTPTGSSVNMAVFGLGGGQNINGYYSAKIDKSGVVWQMVFTEIAAGKILYLEYISDGRAEGGQTVVHPYAEEALTAYVYWKSIQRRRSATQVEKAAARAEWFNEKRQARSRFGSFTKEEAMQSIRKGFKQSPKF